MEVAGGSDGGSGAEGEGARGSFAGGGGDGGFKPEIVSVFGGAGEVASGGERDFFGEGEGAAPGERGDAAGGFEGEFERLFGARAGEFFGGGDFEFAELDAYRCGTGDGFAGLVGDGEGDRVEARLFRGDASEDGCGGDDLKGLLLGLRPRCMAGSRRWRRGVR